MTLSFRTRLTLRWVLAFGLILSLAHLVVYAATREFLVRDLDAQLRTLAGTELASAVDDPGGGIHLHEFSVDPLATDVYADKFVQLIGAQGDVLLQSPRLGVRTSLVDATRLRDAVVKALGEIHSLLNPDQRERFGYMLRTGILAV